VSQKKQKQKKKQQQRLFVAISGHSKVFLVKTLVDNNKKVMIGQQFYLSVYFQVLFSFSRSTRSDIGGSMQGRGVKRKKKGSPQR